MILREGDMFANDHGDTWDFLGVTTCNVIKANGDLVMGAGAARQMAFNYPVLPQAFGHLLHQMNYPHEYRVLVFERFFAVQTKYHWSKPSDLKLIQRSLDTLNRIATGMTHKVFWLNIPGVGHGRLRVNQIMPLVKELPDNVHIWRKST